jgi:hypothetical protein
VSLLLCINVGLECSQKAQRKTAIVDIFWDKIVVNMSDYTGVSLFALSAIVVIALPTVIGTSRRYDDAPTIFNRVSTISAPGKVLVAGGYLVLEHPNLGLSVATSSRFFSSVKLAKLGSGTRCCFGPNTRLSAGNMCILIESPQFHSRYTFMYNPKTDKVSVVGLRNAFVEKCVELTMGFIKEFKAKAAESDQSLPDFIATFANTHALHIVLQAHNDFYSQIKEVY